MKKRFLAGVLVTTLAVGIQAVPLQTVKAAQVRVEETAQLLAEAVQNLEDGTYVEGEALISMEATQAAAFAREGTYRFDADVQVESVNDFGTDEQTGKEMYIAHLTSDKYTTEELMELALSQYYVDGVCANSYRQLYAADPYSDAQWYLNGSGTDSNSKGIRLAKQDVTNKTTPVIAVIDTGVNYNHPDLEASMWNNPFPGVLQGTCGYDFGEDDADPMDHNGHGTHVAGIAAAKSDNGIGITGVSQAKIMALKVTSDKDVELTDAAIIGAYDYIYDALEAGVNIKAVNCSWGGSNDRNGMLSKAINAVGEAGALSVFAAGNDHVNWDNVNKALSTPYDLDSPYVVIVGASNERDEMAYYSDYGADSVDLFAPGSNMLSTYTENLYLPGVYGSSQRKKLSVYFNRFSESADNILPQGQTWGNYYTAKELGIKTDYTVKITRVKNAGNGYLRLDITRNTISAGSEVAGSIYVDVTDLNLNQNATYYVSFLNGAGTASEVCWQGENMVSSPEKTRFVNKDGRTYMRIVGLDIAAQGVGKNTTWYLDDIAISAPDPDPETFGAYEYMEGTSMAAPVVSAAVATLGAANPALSAKNLRSLLLKSVRKVSSLSGKCVTGGIVDAAKFVTLATKVTLNKTSATLAYGKTLTLKAKVSPTYVSSTKVTWKSSNTKYATVSSKGVVKVKKAGIGHTDTITATASDGSKKKATCKIKLKK